LPSQLTKGWRQTYKCTGSASSSSVATFFGEHQRVDGQARIDALVDCVPHELSEFGMHQAFSQKWTS
jgi:hypothetical protein